jgi:hypothetical protein
MNPEDEIKIWKKHYENEIKPLINEEKYKSAGYEMQTLVLTMKGKEETAVGNHAGISFIMAAKGLSEELNKEELNIKNIKKYQEFFEAFSAQTNLPTKHSLEDLENL